MPARGSRGPRGAYSYALYERISERCFLPAGGSKAAGMPRGGNPTTRASAGMLRRHLTFYSLKAQTHEFRNLSLLAAPVTFARPLPSSAAYQLMYPPILAS